MLSGQTDKKKKKGCAYFASLHLHIAMNSSFDFLSLFYEYSNYDVVLKFKSAVHCGQIALFKAFKTTDDVVLFHVSIIIIMKL